MDKDDEFMEIKYDNIKDVETSCDGTIVERTYSRYGVLMSHSEFVKDRYTGGITEIVISPFTGEKEEERSQIRFSSGIESYFSVDCKTGIGSHKAFKIRDDD